MDPPRRHLTLALGVSLFIHAIVLSIHFKLPEALDRARAQALDVILVNSRHASKPTNAQAKAQANLDGGGNTEEARRAKTPLPPTRRSPARQRTDRRPAARRPARGAAARDHDPHRRGSVSARSRTERKPTEQRESRFRVATWPPAPARCCGRKRRSRADRGIQPATASGNFSARASRNTALPSMSKTGGRRSSASATSTTPMRRAASSTATWC